MGTHMLLYPDPEHLRRGGANSWGGNTIMHEADHVVGGSGASGWRTSSGYGVGNTWSRRLAAGNMTDNVDSWEVRAFAEDASTSGQWPPRSYPCSYCQREFRTAQALGGHMNVHRRERANHLAQAQERNEDDGPPTHSHDVEYATTTSTSVEEPYRARGHSSDHRNAQVHGRSEYYSPSLPSQVSISSSDAMYCRNSPYEAGAWRFHSHEKVHSHGAVDLELRLGRKHD